MRGVNISCDMHELTDFCNRVNESLSAEYRREFYKACAKELAARMLALVIPRTPVGVYPEGSGKVGGTLRRGWTAKGNDSKGNGDVAGFLDGLEVTENEGTYTVTLANPVEYAQYVEYGHRTRGGKGWVPGRFMMTISAADVQKMAPQVLERKLEKFLREGMGDK